MIDIVPAKKACDMLGFKNHRDACKRHLSMLPEYVAKIPMQTSKGLRDSLFVTKEGLRRLAQKSKNSDAPEIERRIAWEVMSEAILSTAEKHIDDTFSSAHVQNQLKCDLYRAVSMITNINNLPALEDKQK